MATAHIAAWYERQSRLCFALDLPRLGWKYHGLAKAALEPSL